LKRLDPSLRGDDKPTNSIFMSFVDKNGQMVAIQINFNFKVFVKTG